MQGVEEEVTLHRMYNELIADLPRQFKVRRRCGAAAALSPNGLQTTNPRVNGNGLPWLSGQNLSCKVSVPVRYPAKPVLLHETARLEAKALRRREGYGRGR